MIKDLIDQELELSILARMISNQESLAVGKLRLTSQEFGVITNQKLFAVICEHGTDVEVVKSLLSADPMFRSDAQQTALVEYIDRIFEAEITGELGQDISIVKELSVRRAMLEAAQKTAIAARDLSVSVPTMIAHATDKVSAITKKHAGITAAKIDPMESINRIVAAGASNGVLGFATGFIRLDQAIKGLRGGQLRVIGGEPGVGKTTFAVNEIVQLIKAKPDGSKIPPVGFVALESTHASLEIAFGSQFLGYELERPGISEDEIDKYVEFLGRYREKPLSIYTQQNGTNTPQAVLAVIDEWIRNGVKVIYVDNLSTVNFGSKTEDMRLSVTQFANELKSRATDHGVHITVFAHLNRQTQKEPQMRDLAESAGLERLADIIELVYLTDPTQAENANRDRSGVLYTDITVKVAKARAGRKTRIPYRFYYPVNQIHEFDGDGKLPTMRLLK